MFSVPMFQVQQEHLDAGGIGNDFAVSAVGSKDELEQRKSSWQPLTRHHSVSIGEATSGDKLKLVQSTWYMPRLCFTSTFP